MLDYLINAAWIDAMMDFMAKYGWYIASFFAGILIGLVYYMIHHPEDFYTVETVEEDNTENIEH